MYCLGNLITIFMARSTRRLRLHLKSAQDNLRLAKTKKRNSSNVAALEKEVVWVKAQQTINKSNNHYMSPLKHLQRY
jgi:hypothetical protein